MGRIHKDDVVVDVLLRHNVLTRTGHSLAGNQRGLRAGHSPSNEAVCHDNAIELHRSDIANLKAIIDDVANGGVIGAVRRFDDLNAGRNFGCPCGVIPVVKEPEVIATIIRPTIRIIDERCRAARGKNVVEQTRNRRQVKPTRAGF